MNTSARRVVLALTALLGLVIGVWAAALSRSFYDAFPGFGLHWISTTGPFNDHLVSDVGDFYIALAAVSIVAMPMRSAVPGRIAGVGWSVFGILHLAFHARHLMASPVDSLGTLIGLGVSALLGIVLLLPGRTPRDAEGDVR